MKRKLSECPVCGSGLRVSEYACPECRTRIKGDFICESGLGDFDKEILEFIKVFIFSEGSIKQVEKIMNCSYPKVKNLLKKAKAELGIEDMDTDDGSQDVLDLLAKGELTTEEALEKLSKGGKK